MTWEDAWSGTRARCDEQRQGQTNTHKKVHRGGSHREVINNSQTQVYIMVIIMLPLNPQLGLIDYKVQKPPFQNGSKIEIFDNLCKLSLKFPNFQKVFRG